MHSTSTILDTVILQQNILSYSIYLSSSLGNIFLEIKLIIKLDSKLS
jgi:hypothetical protein